MDFPRPDMEYLGEHSKPSPEMPGHARQAIVVLGMHRSGTSALAGMLGKLGAQLPLQLLPAREDNPKGFFESSEILRIHDRLLLASGTNWFGIEKISDDWFHSAAAAAFVDEIVAALRLDFDDAPLFVIKDPRMCRLMPLWRKVFERIGATPVFAITVRHPSEVARSLNKRDSLALTYGYLLWLRHVLQAESETRGSPRVFVRYEELLRSPMQTARQIASQLGVERLAADEDSARVVDALIDSSLRHHSAETEVLDRPDGVFPWLKQAYGALLDLARDASNRSAQRRLDDLRTLFDPASASFVLDFDESERKLKEQTERIAALQAEREASIAALHEELSAAEQTISQIFSSISWLVTKPFRLTRRLITNVGALITRLVAAVYRVSLAFRRYGPALFNPQIANSTDSAQSKEESRRQYVEWVAKHDTLNDSIRNKIKNHIARLRERPLISVVMPVYNPDPAHLDQAIRSVRAQLYPHWELCIADDASTDSEVRRVIDRHSIEDSRVKAIYRKKNGHISRATNSALTIARGEFVALVDHDDLITEHALYWIAAQLEDHPETDVLYSDSDFVDDSGQRSGPYFKPNFNVELMLGHNMVSHLGVYRRSLIEALGGMRAGFEGSQDYDLLLRVLERSSPDRIRHIPTVLYHWRKSNTAPSYSVTHLKRCISAAREAVREFLANTGVKADVLAAPAAPTWQRIRYHLPEPAPTVSIIIPTKNQAELLRICVRGVLDKTDYPSLEVTIVDHESDDATTRSLLKELAEDPRVCVLPYAGPFNFPAINNFAVERTDGAILAFLNNDIEIVHSDWLREMVSHAVRSKIGAVGAKLYYPNGNIQHAGVVVGMGGVAGHRHLNAPHNFVSPNGDTILTHEVTAVTGACMVVTRSAFNEVGGLDAINLPVAFNDIDFCLRLREHGYRNIFTPFAELIHHESASRGPDFTPARRGVFQKECEYMMERWSALMNNDPYYNPNLSLNLTKAGFAKPPRTTKPWET
jgi:glycosyltransferase involved in cell wall biosynthesis